MTDYEFRLAFAYKLKKMIERRGVSQKELAQRTGISQPVISNYLTLRHVPRIDNFMELCKALNCMPNDLLIFDQKIIDTAKICIRD